MDGHPARAQGCSKALAACRTEVTDSLDIDDDVFGHDLSLSGWLEGEHSLEVPGHGHQAPFAAYILVAAHRELPESDY